MAKHVQITLALSALCCCASGAVGQAPFDWVTIGAPGNRPASQQEAPDLFPPNVPTPIITGAVPYNYRITRTEVTAGQWLDFLNAYWPYATFATNDLILTGFYIRAANTTPGQNPGYHLLPGGANKPMQTSWQMVARYTNWLSNGRGTTAAAFASGAYDTSTFTQNADHSWNDQLTHTAGAHYWIPTLDEWTKAMYYDPSGNGPGQDRYFRYPISSDSPPVPGWPWEGGQTSAGLDLWSGPDLDVGSYPWVTSPWGLLDGSGSVSEWTEWMSPDHLSRAYKGTRQYFPSPEYYDRIDYLFGGFPSLEIQGFRIASDVPGPPSVCIGLPMLLWFSRRRRPCPD
jgi:formylglycine-generating enzyme required for sulfatase activity